MNAMTEITKPSQAEIIAKAAARRAKVVSLMRKEVDAQDIADKLGMCRKMVVRDVCRARKLGDLPPFKPKDARRSRRRFIENSISNAKFGGGTMFDVYENLSIETQQWLIGQIPDGSSVAEVIAAIVTDAYFDEVRT